MAKAIPNPETPWSREPLKGPGGASKPWDNEDLLTKEEERLRQASSAGFSERESAAGGAADAEFVQKLEAENNELRAIVGELQQELEAVSGKSAHDWTERQKEYESLLDEKTELIRQLHVRIQEMEEAAQQMDEQSRRPPTPKEEELIAMSDELERERAQLQQERRKLEEEKRQLREDTEVMNQEMRQMEVQMAKERADLARQRSEMGRISEEIKHELDRIERDRGLTDRLAQLRQRHVDSLKGRSGGQGPGPSAGAPPPPADDPKKDSSGLLRRFRK